MVSISINQSISQTNNTPLFSKQIVVLIQHPITGMFELSSILEIITMIRHYVRQALWEVLRVDDLEVPIPSEWPTLRRTVSRSSWKRSGWPSRSVRPEVFLRRGLSSRHSGFAVV